MKKEMEKSRPGTLPQYLFLFRDDALIGYLFLIAEKEGACKAFPCFDKIMWTLVP